MKRSKTYLLSAVAGLSISLGLSSYFASPAESTSTPATDTEPTATKSLQLIGKLPSVVVESSGLEIADGTGKYWTHNDAGNAPVLYKIDETGKLLEEVTVEGTTNTDWEDLTQDNEGNLYIGDMGNNSNKRQDLHIYKVNPKKNFKVEAIQFSYEDMPEGKLSKRDRNFDCEAFFWHNQHLYLISKDRGASRTAKLYELSDKTGTQTAQLVMKKELPGLVTSADLSPDGKQLAVLTYDKIYLYPVKAGSNQFLSQSPNEIELTNVGQAEAILFKNNNTLVLSNEEGQMFQYAL